MLERLATLEEDNQMLIEELGNSIAWCDKCGGSGDQCLKCSGTGLVQRKYLMDWPW